MEVKNSSSNSLIHLIITSAPIHLPKFKRFYESGGNLTPNRFPKKEYSVARKKSSKQLELLNDTSEKRKKYKHVSLTRQIFQKPFITASSWIIIEGDNYKKLEGKNEDEVREIASLTKIMTCLTAIQEINRRRRSYEEVVTISERAAMIDGTSADLQVGDEVKLWDLLHGLMLPSGNDAAISIAEFIGKMIDKESDPVEKFVEKMNHNALMFNLNNTVFTNPHGMSTSINLSNVKDIAILASHAMKMSIFSRIVSTRKHTCTIFNPIGTRKTE